MSLLGARAPSNIQVALVGDDPIERGAGNRLLLQNLSADRAVVIPTAVDERTLQQQWPGYPSALVVRARWGDRLVGAGVIQVPQGYLEQLAPAIGGEYARVHARRWRLLTHVAVEPELRGQGVGTAMISALERASVRAGARGIYGAAAETDGRSSAAFYLSCGFDVLSEGEQLPPLGGVAVDVIGESSGRAFWKRLARN